MGRHEPTAGVLARLPDVLGARSLPVQAPSRHCASKSIRC
jgi:hypothetical protein